MKNIKPKITIIKISRLATMVLWIILTFYLCQQNGNGSNALSSNLARFCYSLLDWFPFHLDYFTFHVFIRKLAHFSTHFILAVLVFRVVRIMSGPSFPLKKAALICFMVSGAIALFDEFIQVYAISRTPKFTDALINFSGALLGTLLWSFLLHLKYRRP